MSWTLPRTENGSRHSDTSLTRSQAKGVHTTPVAKLVPLAGRIACGLLAAMHISPLCRATRHLLEQGPTPSLVVTLAVLALLVGVLTAKAAGVVFFTAGSRRASITALILAASLFHGDALAGKDIAPVAVAVLGASATTVIAVHVGRRFGDCFAGVGDLFKNLFVSSRWTLLDPAVSHVPLCISGLGEAQPRGPPA